MGARCNPAKLLLDPYGRSVAGNLAWKPSWSGEDATDPNQADLTDSVRQAPRSVFVQSSFDWGADAPLGHPLTDSVIYELHVKGFTAGSPTCRLRLWARCNAACRRRLSGPMRGWLTRR